MYFNKVRNLFVIRLCSLMQVKVDHFAANNRKKEKEGKKAILSTDSFKTINEYKIIIQVIFLNETS